MTSMNREEELRHAMDDLTLETERELARDAFEASQKAIDIVWRTVLTAYQISDQFALQGEVDKLYAQVHTEFDEREDGRQGTPVTMSVLLTRDEYDVQVQPGRIHLHIPLSPRALEAYKALRSDVGEDKGEEREAWSRVFYGELSIKPREIYVREEYAHPSGTYARYMQVSAAGIIEYPAVSAEEAEEQIAEFTNFLEQLQDLEELNVASDAAAEQFLGELLGQDELTAAPREEAERHLFASGPKKDIDTITALRTNIGRMKLTAQKSL